MAEPGPGAEGGGVWGQHAAAGKQKAQQGLDCQLAIQLSSNSLSSKAASLRGRPVFPLYCVFLRHGVQMMAQ